MINIVKVPQRKARDRAAAGGCRYRDRRTQDFAQEHKGCFLVFGSVAERRMSFTSDFDVVVDFPRECENAAVEFVEDLCRREKLPADIHLKSLASERFLARIADRAVTLP
jgi:predicted nucleotidyltransferase